MGNQGFLRIGTPITELVTASIAKNATDRRQNTYSKIINIADCKTSKKRSLAVKYLILTMFNYPTAKTSILYKSTDGPAGRPGDNPPNPDGLGDFPRTVPELTVRVCWQPRQPFWKQFGSDPDPDPMWRSGTVAKTTAMFSVLCICRGISSTVYIMLCIWNYFVYLPWWICILSWYCISALVSVIVYIFAMVFLPLCLLCCICTAVSASVYVLLFI